MYKQFTEYSENGKTDALLELETSSRKKRSIKNDEVHNFLNDMYPGIKQVPTQLVQMLASPGIKPDDKIDSTALIHNQYKKKCEKLKPKCPKYFFRLGSNGKCIHDPRKGMTFADSKSYCSSIENGKAKLFKFETMEETKLLFDYILKGG